MSDGQLRDLERTFRESGSAEAELARLRARARAGVRLDWSSYLRLSELDVEAAAGYLRLRVKAGDLSQGRLEIAAHCGHSAAGCLVTVPDVERIENLDVSAEDKQALGLFVLRLGLELGPWGSWGSPEWRREFEGLVEIAEAVGRGGADPWLALEAALRLDGYLAFTQHSFFLLGLRCMLAAVASAAGARPTHTPSGIWHPDMKAGIQYVFEAVPELEQRKDAILRWSLESAGEESLSGSESGDGSGTGAGRGTGT